MEIRQGQTTNLAWLVMVITCLCFQATLGDQQQKHQSTLSYAFDPSSAAGISGVIRVTYDSPVSSRATLSASLDFSRVDVAGIKTLNANCTLPPTEYQWHIHVKWGASSPNTSASFAQCTKALTGNHYDPLRACGPNSEYADTPDCLSKIASYSCIPAKYAVNPLECEKGDLSGKLGSLKVDASSQRVTGTWVDEHFPLMSETSPQWNIILHAVCGNATPRVACALGQKTEVEDTTEAEAHSSCK